MRIFNELRYPSSNLSEIFTQRMFQASFEKIWKIFFELSRGQAWSYGRTDRQTDRQTDGQTDRRTDAGNDNTPPALGPRGKNCTFHNFSLIFLTVWLNSDTTAGHYWRTDYQIYLDHNQLTHCGLMMANVMRNPGHHWFNWWLHCLFPAKPSQVWDDILTPLYIDPGVNISYDILTPGSIYRNDILTPLTILWPPPNSI